MELFTFIFNISFAMFGEEKAKSLSSHSFNKIREENKESQFVTWFLNRLQGFFVEELKGQNGNMVWHLKNDNNIFIIRYTPSTRVFSCKVFGKDAKKLNKYFNYNNSKYEEEYPEGIVSYEQLMGDDENKDKVSNSLRDLGYNFT